MSSYDVQRRNLYPLIKDAIEKAYSEYGLGLDVELASAETANISKAITDAGYRLATDVADEIFSELKKAMIDEYRYPIIAELKKKYTESEKYNGKV